MKKVWKLYTLALTITERLCRNNCYHLSILNTFEECQAHIKGWLKNDNFQSLKSYNPKKGAKKITYLYTLIGSRLIDFCNSSKIKKEFSIEGNNSLVFTISYDDLEIDHLDLNTILKKITSDLTFEERTLLKYRFVDELTYIEIGDIFGKRAKKISSRIERILLKLRLEAKESGLYLESIL
jgi:RNA polymerase sigma factor (sigma-70 family)